MMFDADGLDCLVERAWVGRGAPAGARFGALGAMAQAAIRLGSLALGRLFGGRLLAIALCLGLLALAAPLAAQPSKVNNPMPELAAMRRALAERMEASTVLVVVVDGSGEINNGTGFMVGEGRVMTNGHVVHDAATMGSGEIYLLNANLPPTKARLLAIDYDRDHNKNFENIDGRDFALLAFDPPTSAKLPILSFNLDARRMDLVGAWGYPKLAMQYDSKYQSLLSGRNKALESPSVVFTEGTVNNIIASGLSAVIMHSADIFEGNSGGPLVNISGEVVGINTMGLIQDEDLATLNIALSARDAVDFLVKSGFKPLLAEDQAMASLNAQPSSSPPLSPPPLSPPELPPSSRKTKDDGQTKVMESFSLKVPSGWGVVFEEDDSVLLAMPDHNSRIWIMVEDNYGLKVQNMAEFYSVMLDGTWPKPNQGLYVFTMEADDQEMVVVVGPLDEDRHFLVSFGGDAEASGVEYIIGSLEER
jgi:S1-C subfamily serine protease